MRRLTLTIALVLRLLVTSTDFSDVTRGARQCPTVQVSCMDTMVCGSSITFTAKVGNAPADAKLSYNWTVSAGTIKMGQGTPSITVDTTELAGISVEATVQVSGLPEACDGKATCATALICDPMDRKVDEYGNLRWGDEKGRLDHFVAELQKDPTAQGYILCYGGRVGRVGEAQRRCHRAVDYVIRRRSLEASRIVTIDGGYKEELAVELFIVPSGVMPPTSSPTVDPHEVRFIKSKTKGRTRR
jgi:hypothetical protein